MPYYISTSQNDCDGWAAVKEESDGSYTTIGCHTNKQDAIDQMVAISISEGMEPGGEVNSRSKMKKIERRTYIVQDVEARQAEDGVMRLSGYAAVFNDASVPLPFKERIAPGAFRKTLSESPDVRLLINHEGLPLARTKNGTLKLTEDDRGLRFDAELADTQEARDIYTLVQRGDVDQMSFAFRVIRQNWSKDKSERTLTEVSLADGDVSVVTYPAYPTTSVEARKKIADALDAIKEGRKLDEDSIKALRDYLSELLDIEGEEEDDDEEYDEEEEIEDDSSRAVDVVGDFVEWDSSGGTARGRIEHVMREGVLGIPDSDFSITAEEGDPAILIRVYREVRDGWEATEVLVGHKSSELRAIDPLSAPSEEQSRTISLRLAKAIIQNTK
jgi:HK97 family phage prohead protease